jgi:hypothetical protein
MSRLDLFAYPISNIALGPVEANWYMGRGVAFHMADSLTIFAPPEEGPVPRSCRPAVCSQGQAFCAAQGQAQDPEGKGK